MNTSRFLCAAALVALPLAVAAAPLENALAAPGGGPLLRAEGSRLWIAEAGNAPRQIELPPAMDAVTAAHDGAAIWVAGRFDLAETSDLWVATVGEDGRLDALPSPPGRQALRSFPTLLGDGEAVVGMVWQEGDRQEENAIRAAAWAGETWGPVETVAAPRGSEQTGLTAVVLADGSWLAVWAAVDSEDDLWWSHRVGGVWSPARRVHPDDATPDILPRLVAAGQGALLAWSSYDGRDYRLRRARFEGDVWSEQPIEGGRGAEPVRWLATGHGLALLSSSVAPEGWNLFELDSAGTVRRSWSASTELEGEPWVVETGAELWLLWPAAGGTAVELALQPAGGES